MARAFRLCFVRNFCNWLRWLRRLIASAKCYSQRFQMQQKMQNWQRKLFVQCRKEFKGKKSKQSAFTCDGFLIREIRKTSFELKSAFTAFNFAAIFFSSSWRINLERSFELDRLMEGFPLDCIWITESRDLFLARLLSLCVIIEQPSLVSCC